MQLPVPARVPFHANHAVSTAGADLGFAALLALAGVGSAVLVGLALAALIRRRSRSYLLVTLALATLFARSAVAALSLTGSVGAASHHWVEHALDAVMAALVVAAVYDARAVRQSDDGGENPRPSVRSDGGPRTGPVRADDERRDDLRGDGLRGDDPGSAGPGADGPGGDEP